MELGCPFMPTAVRPRVFLGCVGTELWFECLPAIGSLFLVNPRLFDPPIGNCRRQQACTRHTANAVSVLMCSALSLVQFGYGRI